MELNVFISKERGLQTHLLWAMFSHQLFHSC